MRKLLIFVFILINSITFAQDQNATQTRILGVKSNASFTFLAVEDDGRIKVNRLPTFSDGSNEATALLDASNSVNVNIKADSRYTATKTTSNVLAASTAATITPIANVQSITVINNDMNLGYEVWVKVGAADAGLNSGVKCSLGLIIENCTQDTIISYWASESVHLAIIQE